MKYFRKVGIVVLLMVTLAVIFFCENLNIAVPKEIDCILEANGINTADIVIIGEYRNKKLNVIDVEVTDEEINEYVAMQLEAFDEIIPVLDRDIVIAGDIVYVSYITEYDDKIINQVEHDNLMVGVGAYDQEFEDALIGQRVGQPFLVELPIINENGNEDLAMFNVTIESINYFKTYELTDQFVQEQFEFLTVEKYYNNCRKILQEQKEREAEKSAERELFMSIMEESSFELNKSEIAEYSLDFVKEHERLAYVYNLDIETYIKEVLEQGIDEFYQGCYDYGEYEVKRYLLIGAIFEDLDFEVSDEEYRSMCEKVECDYEEARKDSYTDALICYKVMEKEVLGYFLANRK